MVECAGGVQRRLTVRDCRREVHVRMPRGAWRRVAVFAGLSLLVSILTGCAMSGADAPMSSVQPNSDHANEIQSLYALVFYLAVVVFIGTMVATLWFTLGFRDDGRRQARQFHGNARLEVLWTIIPVIIVIIIAVPTFDRIFAIGDDPPPDALELEVIGHQFWFEFRIPELNIVTANEVHVPAGRAVSVSLRSEDVIHSFWVPQLFGKTDLVPGHENHLWFTPEEPRAEGYIGQCYELCGLSHANMRFRMFVDSPADFDAWAQRQSSPRTTPSGAAAQGEAVFLRQPCIGCHTVNGTAASGVIGPNLTHFGSRTTMAAGVMPPTAENLSKWIRNSADIKPGSLMPPHLPATLNDQDLQALVAYLQSLQ
jgi:cytochrome c oxidase subunit 2